MERKRKKERLILIVFLVILITLTVAFSSLSKSLTISGAAKYSRWDIHISDTQILSDKSESAQIITMPIISEDGSSIQDYDVVFSNQNDYVSFDFDVSNEGTIPAKLDTLILPSSSGDNKITCTSLANPQVEADANAICNNLTYTLKYADTNEEVKVNDILPSNTVKTLRLTLKLNDVTYSGHTATNDVKIEGLGVTIQYVQSE